MAKTNDTYDIGQAFQAIEDELIASMLRNMKAHKLEEADEGKQWSMWQAEQLKALEKYKRQNQKKYSSQFKDINAKVEALIRHSKAEGSMQQELEILEAIKDGFKGAKRASAGGAAEFFRLNERKLEALIKATTDDMQRAETAVLRMANDQYRKIIFNAQVYANTGAGTYEKAVDMATKDMLSSGLNCIEYKNGARHTLADYAEMAIRTASKRAYLQGEGEKRQEWGITTVIVNKRGNPCPQCLPFVGKVFIDDVWSGGTKDGKSPVTGLKYPLISDAIAAGLYHPRCKDSHTTYFEGISTPPDDKYTRDELDKIAEDYRKEQKEQYAKRQQEKFGRLAKYSLDPENQERYAKRAKEWSEKVAEPQNTFVPARTLEEAQAFAEQYCEQGSIDRTFKGKADFKGIALEHANEINEALEEIYRSYDIPKISGIKTIDPKSAKGKKLFSSEDAVMAYSPAENGIYVNKAILKNKDTLDAYNRKGEEAWDIVMENMDKLSGRQRELAERYKAAGRDLVGNGTAKDYFMHEMGHHMQWEGFDGKTYNAVGDKMSQYSGKISGYATASKSEYFAESFAAYMKGERDILDPDYVAFLDKKLIAKDTGSGIMGLYRKGDTNRKISESGSKIIDKATYHKITKPAIKKGADIRIADGEILERLAKNNASAVTYGDIIYFREDATVSDVLEEVWHFYQNKKGLNSQYTPRQRIILNEIDAKEYLLSVAEKYNIPKEEIELTKKHLQSYTNEMETLKERGEWID